MSDIKIGDSVMVRVPPLSDPALAGKAILRKEGVRGPAGRRYETEEEIKDGLLLGRPATIEKRIEGYYFTENPERAVVTSWLLRQISKGSLVLVEEKQ